MHAVGLSIAMGLYFWFANLRFGYTFSGILKQPLSVALVVGLITGKMSESMTIGAGIQLMFLGVTSTPGGNVPNDPALASTIAIPIAVTVGMNAQAAVALAVPFGVLGVFLDQLRRTINATWVHMADKDAEKLNYRGIYLAAFLYPAIMGLIIRFPVVFVANYFGRGAVQSILDVIPYWLMHGFEVMGAILPALGFALTISVIGKKSLLPYFIIGFVAVMYFKADVMAVAAIGTCVAFLVRNNALREENA
ncbi:PTS mannose/fructose/sorbose/N-acetylgalactosamine transporter subunit IIC [Lacticaseibacillus paracasei]|jgi:D-glucosaminate-specific PTS system IIC component|uniref:PTS system mannose-specific IIC component n=2 Tax=Lacticaseibacillus paracasei TaxID=1597 RepID=A0A0C9QE06_LACPA|nr:PTS sugar transporter subunit IIC [Lacticaseibacillus paracasei]EPC94176.1 PTS system sorbose-specific iic component family protein [Lacticaseibacillus paracasei subsp. paracasei CNCM I-4649]PTS47218.1 PTS sugar transporter subunit IIC [Lactobacillus sp. DS9_6]PTS57156.1 PTS sugar transporter subunit IIC [Lactobacillus sp. DS15_6]PTS67452.1 PTS sugar transporter subunit IIC [Lactobacillus sp. DS3_6]PTV37603.1 PTS sugar transporter subunit IIC [Lactobacillus sp. DS18_6]